MKRFAKNEDGIATAWAIGWLILCFAIAGLAVDVTNAWKVKQFLQTTADVSAHAGGLNLSNVGNSTIVQAVTDDANEMASINMNPERYGDVLVDSDIHVGFWDQDEKVFTKFIGGSEIPNAVKVVTRQDGTASSRVGTFFLRFIGFDAFTVAASATVESFVSECEKDGLLARGIVRLSTQQTFLNKFCVHGQQGVNAADQNYFEEGTFVGMVDRDNCGPLPENCTDEYNPGIESALIQQNMPLSKIDRLPQTIDNLLIPTHEDQPDYITDPNVNVIGILTSQDFDVTQLKPNAVNYIECRINQNINLGGLANLTNKGNDSTTGEDSIAQYETYSNMVIVGDLCNFSFDQSVSFEDTIIATTAEGQSTFSGSADVRLGKDDKCDPEGSVALLTKGNVNFASKLSAYDLEIIAAKNVHFASKANEGESVHVGTNVYSGGDISVTTKHTFERCDDPNDPKIDLKYTLRYVE